MTPYVHELSPDDWKRLEDAGTTYGELAEQYEQPPWCTAYGAVDAMGCWSLVSTRTIHRYDDCRSCKYQRKGLLEAPK